MFIADVIAQSFNLMQFNEISAVWLQNVTRSSRHELVVASFEVESVIADPLLLSPELPEHRHHGQNEEGESLDTGCP